MGSLQSLRSLHYISHDKLFESGLEPDLYGRGHDGIFGMGARARTQHEARKALERVRRHRTQVKPGEYVEIDVYGRGDSRVFGKGAKVDNRREAYARLRRAQSRKAKEDGALRKENSRDVFSTPVGEVSGNLRVGNGAGGQPSHYLKSTVSGKSMMSDATSMVSDVPQQLGKKATYEEYGDEALVTRVNDDTDGESDDFQSSVAFGDLKSTEADMASEAPSFISSLQNDASTYRDYDYAESYSIRDASRSRIDEFSERRISVGSHYVNPSRETSDAATVENWDMRNSFGEENVEGPSSTDLTGSIPGYSHRRFNRGTGTPRLSDTGEFAEDPLLHR
eukprot:Plantae.Rhodophyta-Hildenbrandia_rubra.ctg1255.p2 GENE.Plantae.Rhodophyta-Hildenbrandia_rubra.ctg1255~~Plantae.Rhodophyta-Hildenbrandia_rubra.ctg1255.p2  ORF type:complete len:336 (+),score=70.39 Plantae.Rhodophyta-Hildenbrandia_rubra.ctg1255:350-1357(+)